MGSPLILPFLRLLQACGICGIACHSQCREGLPPKIANDCKRVALSSDGALTMRPGWLISQSSFEHIRDALGAASQSGNSLIPKTSSFGSMNLLNGSRNRSSFSLDGAAGTSGAAESSAAAGSRKTRGSTDVQPPAKDDGAKEKGREGRDRGQMYRMHHHWVRYATPLAAVVRVELSRSIYLRRAISASQFRNNM